MKTKGVFIAILIVIVVYILSWIPWLVLRGNDKIVSSLQDIEKHDAAIIFGGLHETNEELTETNRERLLAGVTLIKEDKASRLTISNTPEAAEAMKTFLLEHGIIENQLELDTTAIVTEDSCVAERNNHPEGRSVIFVSHGYHLPRLIFSCKRQGVSGIGIAAEKVAPIKRSEVSPLTTVSIRLVRYHREAALTVLNILGIYGPTVEKEF